MRLIIISACLLIFCLGLSAQKQTDSNTPLHLLKPDYKTPYGKPEVKDIVAVLDRIYDYLNENTPASLVKKVKEQKKNELQTPDSPPLVANEGYDEVTDYSKIDVNTIFKPGDFRLISYEWGVTYAGMLLATEATGDPKYASYTFNRLKFLSEVRHWFVKLEENKPGVRHAMTSVIHPRALDDCGAMCAAMIKTKRLHPEFELDPMISNFIQYISTGQQRFSDGTLARNRPQPNTLWLDDLFMSVPALAQMGKYSGDAKYYDDAVKQVLQFSKRMFNYEKGLYMHGWVQEMEEHPQFHWARANGWAVMTMVELLDVLPENYEGRDKVLDLLRRHIRGLANYQSGEGFWHQLIDRNDSYLETSATAIYAYSIARAINREWIDAKVYAPMAMLAWNAVTTKINTLGQVEGTCVGTGMAFDPAFYYYRPVSVYAAHGYGPVLLAGAEMISLVKKFHLEINDSSLQLYENQPTSNTNLKFDFGSGTAPEGFQKVEPASRWTAEKGYGLLSEKQPVAINSTGKNKESYDFLTCDQPFLFMVKLPEGRYEVTLTLGDPQGESVTTVKAESRRLMLENVKTIKGQTVQKKIIVDVRTPKINPTEQIRLKERELKYLNWDDKLTLEFSGNRPCVSSVEIQKMTDLPVIYLAGNSTVTDQEEEPWASWGQMFPRFLKPEVVVANYAESGESLLSFKGEKRLQKIMSLIKPGDFLMIEFAHNDQKPGSSHVDPFTTYRDELKFFIREARNKRANPVLVTSMHRRKFDENGKILNTLEDYPEAMRQTAKEENVPLIDLNAMSKILYEALGPENSKKAFVHYPSNSFPGQVNALADDTHFNPYGAYELAKCVVESIRQNIPELSKFLFTDVKPFNPAKPDPVEKFSVPVSRKYSLEKPVGN
jgi:rhamnogalacturonyl hydrolase YesR/lysophospholipase L1-like esterase